MGLLIAISCTPTVLKAQEVSLTLNDALSAAMENNSAIELAGLDEESARAKFRQTSAIFLPQVRLSYTAMTTNNPLNAFGLRLQQQSVAAADFNPEVLNYPAATENFATKAEWTQPLVNFDMILMRQSAQANREVYAFKKKRTMELVMFEVQSAYAALQLAHQARHVLEETVRTVKSIYNATNNRFEKGYLQKSDVLQVQVQLVTTEQKLAEANSNVGNASDYLGLLMGAPSGIVYLADTTRRMNALSYTERSVPQNRADFLATSAAIAAQEKMIRSGKMSYLPKLNAFAEYMFNDDDAFGFGSDAYFAGLQLSWSVFNGMATRHKVDEQQVEKRKSERQFSYQKEQAQLELDKTFRQLEDARLAVGRQDVAVLQAAEALRILENRYQQGLVTTTDVLQGQTLLSQQKLNLAQAIFQYNTTIAYVEFLTSTSENNKW